MTEKEVTDKTLKAISLYDEINDKDYRLVLKALSDVELNIHYHIRLETPGYSRLIMHTTKKNEAIEKFHYYTGYYQALSDSKIGY